MRGFSFLGRGRRRDPQQPKVFRVGRTSLTIADIETSIAPLIVHELKKNYYGFKRIRFAPADVVIDIGGHVGIVSIYLAKKYPFLKVYAFEPVQTNYQYFLKNFELNNITNIVVSSRAVIADGRDVDFIMNVENTGVTRAFSGEGPRVFSSSFIDH